MKEFKNKNFGGGALTAWSAAKRLRGREVKFFTENKIH